MTFKLFVGIFVLGFGAGASVAQNVPDATVYDETIPLIVGHETLLYPALARQANIQGVVVLKAELDDQGKVVSASAISGPRMLVPICLENIKTWRFSRRDSRRTANPVVILYDFRLEGSCVEQCGTAITIRPRNVVQIMSGRPIPDHIPAW